MSTTGYLVDFSLPELFQFLDQGEKTGKLSLTFLPENEPPQQKSHYIWFRHGRIVASSSNTEGTGLISLMDQKGFLTPSILNYHNNIYAQDAPLGLSLKSHGFLDAEQLKMLFYSQVMRKVCDLFQIHNAWFEFEENAPLSFAEMTGLSSPGTDLTLAGLRALRDWTALTPKLPQDTSALAKTNDSQPTISINNSEQSIWQLSDGITTVKEMSKKLEMSLEKVKEIGFRLIAIGLVEEIPMVTMNNNLGVEPDISLDDSTNSNNGLSPDFLSSLMGFLTQV
jgi:hypothetical protein